MAVVCRALRYRQRSHRAARGDDGRAESRHLLRSRISSRFRPKSWPRVASLAAEAGIDAASLDTRVGDASPLLRSRIYLARALALDPAILVLEHPTANSRPTRRRHSRLSSAASPAARRLTTLGLLMDEKFAKATGGRLLFWQPATGEMDAAVAFAKALRDFGRQA